MTIEIRRQDRIPPTASGKHACVISEVSAETCTDE